MKTEHLSPCSQEAATCCHPQPVQSSPHTRTCFFRTNLNIIPASMPGCFKQSLSSRLSSQNFVSISPLSCTQHAPSEGYKSRSSTICNFLQPPVTFSCLDPSILLCTPRQPHKDPKLQTCVLS